MSLPPARARSGAGGALRALALAAGGAAAVGLLVLHARLLWLRVSGGSILDAAVGLRWGLSALLLLAVVALRRRVHALPSGRRALVFWLLVAVLHWNAGSAETGPGPWHSRAGVETLFLLPAASAGLAFGVGLVLLSAWRRHATPSLAVPLCPAFAAAPAVRDGWSLSLAPRPPPA